jgi:Endonuclease-reverse transcriptase
VQRAKDRVFERARPRTDDATPSLRINHGGICVFVRSHIRINAVEFQTYKTFEILPLFQRTRALTSVFVTIYQPRPSSAVTEEFFSEFSDVLERCLSYAHCVIVGDINIHIDDSSCAQSVKFLSLLEEFNLSERVGCKTTKSHQLDVVIADSVDSMSTICVDPPLLSDHSLITIS